MVVDGGESGFNRVDRAERVDGDESGFSRVDRVATAAQPQPQPFVVAPAAQCTFD